MRATTIKASAGGVGAVVSYLEGRGSVGADRSAVGYYLDDDEPPGYWWGDGRGSVDLAGEVESGQLGRMLDARHPSTGERVGRGFGDSSARAFDCTFSAPKSVSVLWALTADDGVRREVLAAHDAAVEAGLGWLQLHGCHTRRGTDGEFQIDARGLTAAVFRQHTSRADEPQLHSHAVVWSKVQDETGKWLALDARFLKTQQRTIGWIYDAALRSELSRRLGTAWRSVPDGAGQSDLVDVPAGLCDQFSTRSRQIEAKLDELIGRWMDEHGEEPDVRTIADLQRKAALASRRSKSHGLTVESLRTWWADRAEAAGFAPPAVSSQPRQVDSPAPMDRAWIIDEMLRRASAEAATWTAADLARHASALIPPGAASGDTLLDEIDRLAAEGFARSTELHPSALGPARPSDGRPATEHVTDRIATTEAVLEQERRLLAWSARSVGPSRDGVVALDRQRAAAEAIAGTAKLVLVVGPAGAGKTTAVRHAVAGLDYQGRRVIGLAPSGKAADVLAREAGCPALTLAKFLHTAAHAVPAGTTLVLDEAGMASTDDLDELVCRADRHGWRLACVGDPEQLPAVGRGGMFAHWCDELPTHDLDEIHRFSEPWQVEASLGLRRGDAAAVAAYVDHRRVRTVHPALLARRVADQYANRTAAGDSVAITTTSADTAREVNLEIQRQTSPAGPTARLRDGTAACAGDRIATRRNDARLLTTAGVAVRNRHTWDVERVAPDGSVVVADGERGAVRLPSDYVAQHVELGWAVTGYGNQGITTDHAVCVIERSSTRAGVYVGLTRGRDRNVAIVADPTGTLDPAEALAAAIARPGNSLTAHAQRANLYRSKGLAPPEPSHPTPAVDHRPGVALDDADRMRQRLDAFAAEQRGPARALGR